MKRIFLLLTIVFATITANSQIVSDQIPPQSLVDQIVALYDNGNYDKCRELLEANKQYPWFLNRLGNLYYNGNGVAKDYSTAVEYYTKAANRGYSQSQLYLGLAYENGEGVVKDLDLAMAWYKKAAENDHAIAQNFLGDLYYNRYSTSNNADDAASALFWQNKAAEQGVPQAIYTMGVFYAEGIVVANDDTVALKYFKRAKELGAEDAQIWIDEIGNPVITPYIPNPQNNK